jgi:ribonuclease P protein component
MVESAGRHTFGPHQRLRQRKQFLLAYDEGSRQHGRFMTVFVTPNGLTAARLGVSATRRFGGAVTRNAAKRRLREAFRRFIAPATTGVDIVVIPKADLMAAEFSQVADELARLSSKPLRPRARSGRVTR